MRHHPKNYIAPGESEAKAPLLPIVVMLFNTCIMWGGFFMLIPLLAVHITQNLLLGASLAGLVLAVRQFIQQGLGFFFGSLSDMFGHRRLMVMGFYVRAVGFGWLAIATEPFGLLMGSIVAALGGALFEASGKAALASISKGYSRASIFSLNSTIGNIGMAVGPLIGVALMFILCPALWFCCLCRLSILPSRKNLLSV
jgi:MFS transporter, DHA1 family, multidrug resistance protein